MTPQTLRKNVKIGFLGIVMVLLLLPMLIQGGSPNIPIDNNLNPDSHFESTTLSDQSSSDYTTLPYLRNSTPYLNWVELLINNATLPKSPADQYLPLYYSQTDRSGENITDNHHYFEDTVVFLDGLASLVGYSNNQILAYFQNLKDYPFWDESTNDPGFYSYITADTQSNSSVKEVKGNAQYILSLNKLLEDTSTKSQASGLIHNQWNVLSESFLDTDNLLYNHSNYNGQKYIEDQFLVALSGFLINKYSLADAAGAKAEANKIMEILIDEYATENYLIYSENAFDYKRDVDLSTTISSSIRDLETNAYGILALLEWFLSDELVENSNYQRVEKAEAIFSNFYRHLWNENYSLFMNAMSKAGSVVIDHTISVEANAIMMLAIEKLFQITGNFTYYQICMEMFQGIQKNLRDPVYGTYYTSLNSTSSQINITKSLKTHSYLLRTYIELNEFAQHSSVSLSLNQTEFIKGEETPLNVSAEYLFDFSLTAGDFTQQKSYEIINASFFYVFRSPNGSILETYDIFGNNSGKSSLLFNFSEDMDFGEYYIDLRVNYTGISTKFDSATFILQPGIDIINLVLQNKKIRCGTELNVSFSINSEKLTNFTVDIDIEGDFITNETFNNHLILAETLNNFSFIVDVDQKADFGDSEILIKILNNSLLYDEASISYSIISSIEVISVQQDATVFRARNFSTIVTVENTKNFAESIILEFSGEFISTVNQTIDLVAFQSITLDLISFINQEAPLGDLNYELKIKRESDNSLIESYSLSSTIKNPIEILYLTPPESSYQWRENNIICAVQNNMDSIQEIKVYLNGDLISSLTKVAPGENILSIPIGETLRNPYELGMKSYTIEIYDINGMMLYQDTISTNVEPSLGSILLGYVLPLAIPIIGIVVVKHMALENKKRLM